MSTEGTQDATLADLQAAAEASTDETPDDRPGEDEYPKVVVTVTIDSYADDGAQYTLVFPDGMRRQIGDAQDDYMVLADVIDRAAGDLA